MILAGLPGARSLHRVSTALLRQTAAYGLFAANVEGGGAYFRSDYAKRIALTTAIFQVFEGAVNLQFEEGETPLCYNRVRWPSGGRIAGWSHAGDEVRASDLIASYVGNWQLDWNTANAGSSVSRIVRCALFMCAERGLSGALCYLSDLSRHGFIVRTSSLASAIDALLCVRQIAGSDKELVRLAFGGTVPDGNQVWMSADFSPPSEIPALDPDHCGDAADTLLEVAMDAADLAREAQDYDEWLVGQHHLSMWLNAITTVLGKVSASLPLHARAIMKQLEEIRADSGVLLLGSHAGLLSHPLKEIWQHYVGLAVVIKHSAGDGWEERLINERAFLPRVLAPWFLEFAAGRNDRVPPLAWAGVSSALATPYAAGVYNHLELRYMPSDPGSSRDLKRANERMLEALQQAMALANDGRMQEAGALQDRMVEQYPWAEFPKWERGILHDKQGAPDRALELIEAAVIIEPSHGLLWHSLAVVLERLGQHHEAKLAMAVSQMIGRG